MSEWEIIEEVRDASIKVIGVGGGGGNAVQHMVESGMKALNLSQSIPISKHWIKMMQY